MTPTELLDKAKKLISGDKPKAYGKFSDNVSDIQHIMHGMTGRRPTRHEVHSFFLARKLCRHGNGNGIGEEDSVDAIGYIALNNEDNKI